MHKYIIAAGALNESIALSSVKPLNNAFSLPSSPINVRLNLQFPVLHNASELHQNLRRRGQTTVFDCDAVSQMVPGSASRVGYRALLETTFISDDFAGRRRESQLVLHYGEPISRGRIRAILRRSLASSKNELRCARLTVTRHGECPNRVVRSASASPDSSVLHCQAVLDERIAPWLLARSIGIRAHRRWNTRSSSTFSVALASNAGSGRNERHRQKSVATGLPCCIRATPRRFRSRWEMHVGMQKETCDIGLIGLAVMGQNLVWYE